MSCERVFQPHLCGQPVVVLSNNDGCIIALSDEAKKLGLERCQPYFQVKQLCRLHNVAVFSSNYELYGDMSQRVMDKIRELCPKLEIYSIDEAFVELEYHPNLLAEMREIQAKILQCTGIPVSIGAGVTKTLAKAANYCAKQQTATKLYSLLDKETIGQTLPTIKIDNIWGIGIRYAARLQKEGIQNADELSCYDPEMIRKKYNIMLARLVYELRGEQCLALEDIKQKKSITSSRSFSRASASLSILQEAIANYAAKLAFKLRQQNLKANGIIVFAQTNKFAHKRFYVRRIVGSLGGASNNTIVITSKAKSLLQKIFAHNIKYQKVGVTVFDLVSLQQEQTNLTTVSKTQRQDCLMRVLDAINAKFCTDKVMLAAQGTKREWQMRRQMKSRNYTTSWQELPLVR